MNLRLGDILVERGVLSEQQKREALAFQAERAVPLGLVCERLFGLAPEIIEDAWAVQYATLTRTIDPRIEVFESQALGLVSRRQAWQFRVLPIRFDDRELMIATASAHLRRALRFATRFINAPAYFVVADPISLGESMCKHYPLGGMTPQSINDSAMDDLLNLARSSCAVSGGWVTCRR